MSLLLFFLFGGLAVVAAVAVILHPHPVYSALALVVTLFQVALLFLLLDAHAVAFLQVVIYAGAIMVLFLFVIMLLNVQQDTEHLRTGSRWPAIGLGLVLAFELLVLFGRGSLPAREQKLGVEFGSIAAISGKLFTDHALSFELTSVLLLVAVVGSVVLAKRRAD